MPLRLIPINKHRPAGIFSTRKRVLEGLRAAAVTIWKNDVKQLPTSTHVYTSVVRAVEGRKKGQPNRFYPSDKAILNHFESLNHAWWALGYEVATLTHKKLHRIITPEIHQKLQYLYRFQKVKKTKRPADAPTLREYAAQLSKKLDIQIGHHNICQYARRQGWVEPKEPVWSRVELQLLDKYAHLSPVVIQKRFKAAGFRRTEGAIFVMRKRRRSHKGARYYSANAAATLLGIDPHKFDREWLIKFRDELKFELKGTSRQEDTKLFHIDTLREFFCNHPEEIDLSKVDKIWFLWLITNGRVKMVAPSNRLSLRSEGYRPDAAREHRKTRRPKAA
jgi:hypothetical protein